MEVSPHPVIAVQAAVFGEIFSAKGGLRQRLITAANQLQYDAPLALVFALAIVALVINGVIGAFERFFLRWRANQQSTQVVSL